MVEIVDVSEEHVRFVTLCTHVDDVDEEMDRAARVRERWLRDTLPQGLKVKVAVDTGGAVGFAQCVPIELGAWGMSGRDLMTVPCLTLSYTRVYRRETGSGYGRALMAAVEEEARKETKGVAVCAKDDGFWFMPAPFFERLGYREVARRRTVVIMLKAFGPVEIPTMHQLDYQPQLVPGKVVVDAFWNPVCMTSLVEIQRVREVCAEYGGEVVLNEYDCGRKDVLERYQTARAIFVKGERKDWGYEAPRDGLRQEIDRVLEAVRRGG